LSGDDHVGVDEPMEEDPSVGWSLAGLNASVTAEDAWKTWATYLFWYAAMVTGALIVVSVWDHLDRRREVEPFVQPMEIHADGRVVLLQPAKPLREFVIPPEAIQFMLSRLVVDLRRKSPDASVNEDSRRNILASVCGPSSKTVTTPALRDADLFVVNLESVHPGVSARTWHAEWSETWYDKQQLPKGEHRFRADFTLARRDLDWTQKDSMAVFLRNPVSLCLEAALVHKVPTP
jgi:hypothetical protein